jgi:hypothetical protein
MESTTTDRQLKTSSEHRQCVVHVRLTRSERERLGTLSKRLGKPMAAVLLGGLSAAEQALRERDAAREAKEKERREELDFLDSPEGQAMLAEHERRYGPTSAERIREWRRRSPRGWPEPTGTES